MKRVYINGFIKRREKTCVRRYTVVQVRVIFWADQRTAVIEEAPPNMPTESASGTIIYTQAKLLMKHIILHRCSCLYAGAPVGSGGYLAAVEVKMCTLMSIIVPVCASARS